MILAGGDSFIFGSELTDCLDGRATSYSHNTFTALLASGKYICAAYPGYSNFEIANSLKRTLKQIHVIPFIIVCWTWPNRDQLHTSPKVIKDFQYYCEYHKFPYMFTCADNCLIELLDVNMNMNNWYLFPPGDSSPDQTSTPRGFYQWAVENKYTCGVQHHPLEEAHQDAANLMREKFNELAIKFL